MELNLLRHVLENEIIVEGGGVEPAKHLLILIARILCAEVIDHLPDAPLSGEDHATSLETGEILRVHFELEELLATAREIHSAICLSQPLLFIVEDSLQIVEHEELLTGVLLFLFLGLEAFLLFSLGLCAFSPVGLALVFVDLFKDIPMPLLFLGIVREQEGLASLGLPWVKHDHLPIIRQGRNYTDVALSEEEHGLL